jgi:hypothetical protein
MSVVVGQSVQYIRPGGVPPLAGIVCQVGGADANIVYWNENGIQNVRQNCPVLIPGQTSPKGDYCQALPAAGAPGIAPASSAPPKVKP